MLKVAELGHQLVRDMDQTALFQKKMATKSQRREKNGLHCKHCAYPHMEGSWHLPFR